MMMLIMFLLLSAGRHTTMTNVRLLPADLRILAVSALLLASLGSGENEWD